MKKKLVSIFLSLAMAVTMMPAMASSVFADGETPITSIDLSNINFGAGWRGETVDTIKNSINLDGTNYSNTNLVFVDINDQYGQLDYFEPDKTYKAMIVLTASEGYKFSFEFGDGPIYHFNNISFASNNNIQESRAYPATSETGGVENLSESKYIYIQVVFTATATSIDAVDFSSCPIGMGWAGKTSSELAETLGKTTIEHCTFYQCDIVDLSNQANGNFTPNPRNERVASVMIVLPRPIVHDTMS